MGLSRKLQVASPDSIGARRMAMLSLRPGREMVLESIDIDADDLLIIIGTKKKLAKLEKAYEEGESHP